MKKILILNLIMLISFTALSQTYNAYYVIYGEDYLGETIKTGEANTNEVFIFSSSEVKHSKKVGTAVLTTYTYKVIDKKTKSDGSIYYECTNDEAGKVYFLIIPSKKWIMFMEEITINKYTYK